MTINNAQALRMRYFLTQNNAKMEKEEVKKIQEAAPDVWACVDNSYKWMATDEDGKVWLYENEPYLIPGGWWMGGDDKALLLLPINGPCSNWKDTLTQRPAK